MVDKKLADQLERIADVLESKTLDLRVVTAQGEPVHVVVHPSERLREALEGIAAELGEGLRAIADALATRGAK